MLFKVQRVHEHTKHVPVGIPLDDPRPGSEKPRCSAHRKCSVIGHGSSFCTLHNGS